MNKKLNSSLEKHVNSVCFDLYIDNACQFELAISDFRMMAEEIGQKEEICQKVEHSFI
jgi:hypothetical protein